MDLGAQLAALAAALTAGGVPASPNPAAVNTPGAWVSVDAITGWTLAGGAELRARVVLVTGDLDEQRAASALGQLLDAAAAVVPPMSDVTAENLILPGDPTPLPALSYTHDIPLN